MIDLKGYLFAVFIAALGGFLLGMTVAGGLYVNKAREIEAACIEDLNTLGQECINRIWRSPKDD